tara:strand:- start:1148 stop:1345 length:198 start_codon:yes stop_codon:yes gene_type:complete
MIGFGPQNVIDEMLNKEEIQSKERPKDFEYLSAPDSNGVRRQLKMPSTTKALQTLHYNHIYSWLE